MISKMNLTGSFMEVTWDTSNDLLTVKTVFLLNEFFFLFVTTRFFFRSMSQRLGVPKHDSCSYKSPFYIFSLKRNYSSTCSSTVKLHKRHSSSLVLRQESMRIVNDSKPIVYLYWSCAVIQLHVGKVLGVGILGI